MPLPRGGGLAMLAWLADTVSAVAFAFFLAQLLALLVAGDVLIKGAWGLAILLVIAALARGAAQGGAAILGLQRSIAVASAMRGRSAPAFMTSLTARRRLVGEDAELVIDGIDRVEPYIARFLPLRYAAMLSPLLIAGAAYFASWVAATIFLATLLPFAIGMALAGGAARAASDEQFGALSRLGGLFVDRVRALPLILSYGAEERVTRHIGVAAQDLAARTFAVLRIAFLSSAILEFFSALSVALVAVYCGFALLGLLPFAPPERLDFASAFFVLALAPEFYLGMRRLAAAYHDKQQGEAALASLANETSKLPQLVASAPTSHEVSLTIDRLCFRHPDGVAIGPISAKWSAPGLHLVTGPSGSGKTSLLRAMIGQVPVEAGAIYIGKTAAAPREIAACCGWAGQRPLILPGTLRTNLLLDRWKGSESDAKAMLEAFGLGDLVTARGGGLDWSVDDRGSGLSGGERRRIGLVRALLSPRSILLLDEPTADLDGVTANAVLASLLCEARTRLVVVATHDPLLIAAASTKMALG